MSEQPPHDLPASDDFWFRKADSPHSPYFPYGTDGEISAGLWFLEVIRRTQAEGPMDNKESYADDFDNMICIYRDEFCQVLENELTWLQQVARDLEVDGRPPKRPREPAMLLQGGIDQAIISADRFLGMIRRSGQAWSPADHRPSARDTFELVLSYADNFRQVIETDLAWRKDEFHEEATRDRRHEEENIYRLRRDIDLYEGRCSDLGEPQADEGSN